MSVEKLLLTLKKEGELRQEAVLEQAREEAEKILADAGDMVKQMDIQINRERQKLAEKIKKIKSSRKTVAARAAKSLLVKRYTDSIKALCRENFREYMDKEDYDEFINRQLGRARLELGGISEFRADPRTARALSSRIKKDEKVVEDSSISGGFVAVSKEGRIKLRCDFDSMMEKAWWRCAPDIVKKIYETVENVD
ncbi:MAG: hypothetical protein ACE5EN_04040 [Nitrospinota bacterium]